MSHARSALIPIPSQGPATTAGGDGTNTTSGSEFERALYNQIDALNKKIQALESNVDDALYENDQISASVAALRSMRDQLQEELDALVPLSTDAVETAKYEANEIKKTMLENELVHAEETLRLVARRIQDLVTQRMNRDADADNYARRVLAMQKLINRPRGVGTSSSAVRELKQLEQENRNLSEQIIALRIATQHNEDPAAPSPTAGVANDNRTSDQKLRDAESQRAQLDHDERAMQSSLEARIAQAERALQLEYQEKLRQLVVRFEGTRFASLLSVRNKEEEATMTPMDLLQRALDEARRAKGNAGATKRAARGGKGSLEEHDASQPPPPRSVTEQISELASERAKTTASARVVASQVHRYQTLQDENAALLGLLSKMANEVRTTNQSVKDMAQQLEALQVRLADEASHRQQWIEHDAEHLNAALVDAINKKEEELKVLHVQIAEWREHAEKLQTVSPVVQKVIAQTSTAAVEPSSSHRQYRQQLAAPATPVRVSGVSSSSSSPFHQAHNRTGSVPPAGDNNNTIIRRSMLLDL
jgi:HAMP domain-containing protein